MPNLRALVSLPAKTGLVLLLLTSAPALAEHAGRIIIAAGSVQATADGGTRRDLARGDAVDVGDTITTDADGRTQIRFIDGGLVALRPDTEYHIDDFSFVAGQERQAATLRRGALSTLTGGAARKARDRYRLSTPLAVIGVRGTVYEVALATSGELYLGVSEGAIRATATRAAGAAPGFADLGVGEDYRFALFKADGSISMLAERPQLLEALSRVGRGRDGQGRTASERGGTHRDGRHDGGVDAGQQGSKRQGEGALSGAIDHLDNALGGDLRKPGASNFPALQPAIGPGAGSGPGLVPSPGPGPGTNSPLDAISPIKGAIAPLQRG